MREGLIRPLWLVLVLAAFCLPLFIGLGRTDLENDEAIYSFAVDEILASGDWLNPRLSPDTNNVFLEKPPLKFWIVGAPIRLGLLPHDEFGLRFWDAVFGAIAFLYVFALGRLLAGPICGAIAVMVLFVYSPLLFEHGLRGNNMEAPLFLCYCAGVFHYQAWAQSPSRRDRRWHILAIGLYFFLGFMTKFVAALFLPIFLGVAALALPATRQRLKEDVIPWLGMALLVVALAAPWFVYQYMREGAGFWRVILKEHVYTRFTSALDPAHVHPWDFYFRAVFNELQHTGTLWLTLAGSGAAVRRGPQANAGRGRRGHRLVRDPDGVDGHRHLEASSLRLSVRPAAGAGRRVRSGMAPPRGARPGRRAHARSAGEDDGATALQCHRPQHAHGVSRSWRSSSRS